MNRLGQSPTLNHANSRFVGMQGTTKGPSVKRGGFRMTRVGAMSDMQEG